LDHISAIETPKRVSTVAIGGINASNIQRVLYQSRGTFRSLDGVAVVSAIMGAKNPTESALQLRSLLKEPPKFHVELKSEDKFREVPQLLAKVPSIVRNLRELGPLSQ
jgi:thiamine-phosphate diphosphorylase / hydroxyethylthiazole kinase